MKHKHADLIKQWADGAQIQHHHQFEDRWDDVDNPRWLDDHNYRIKPEPKPDTISFLCVLDPSGIVFSMVGANLKLTFDGETNKLKSAEVLK
jgi:hypothetical protein